MTRGRVGAGAVGVDDVAARGDCAAQFASYRDCLADVARECAGPGAGAGQGGASSCTNEDARQLYAPLAESDNADALTLFIQTCPNSPQANFARLRLQGLQGAAAPAPEPSAVPAVEPSAPPPPAFPTKADYRAAQTELRRLRLYDSGIDGDWGPGSRRAMAAFQRQAGIAPADGALTELSLAALRLTPTPAPQPAASAPSRAHGETFKDCPQCPEMIALRGGVFTMGSPDNEPERDTDEGPQRRVTLAGFAVGKYEVTFAQWDACADAGGCSYRPKDAWGRGDQPVMRVSWNDAQEYVRWLSQQTGQTYRLPSEAEWEYAARAGTETPFHTGPRITPEQANFAAIHSYNGSAKGVWRKQTVPVGSFPANGWGLHDVHGNVSEWVQDCRHFDYSGAPSDGSAWMNDRNGDCSSAVLRGGSWSRTPAVIRSANRNRFFRDDSNSSIGFRVAQTLIR
ncbi:MAG: SUMF1/EgtB/PvdO family nonheme iron enzyme [Rhodobacteraceae bacterium]|nr:SUMF1/EgtB/PvdO family nonheme iron enzyme [Paracoccaceae bacterium]